MLTSAPRTCFLLVHKHLHFGKCRHRPLSETCVDAKVHHQNFPGPWSLGARGFKHFEASRTWHASFFCCRAILFAAVQLALSKVHLLGEPQLEISWCYWPCSNRASQSVSTARLVQSLVHGDNAVSQDLCCRASDGCRGLLRGHRICQQDASDRLEYNVAFCKRCARRCVQDPDETLKRKTLDLSEPRSTTRV